MSDQQKSSVVITGFGTVSSLGVKADSVWHNLTSLNKHSDFYSTEIAPPYIVHPVADFDAAGFIDAKSLLRSMSRSQVYAMVAVHQALEMAGLTKAHSLIEDATLVVACNDGNRDEKKDEQLYSSWFEDTGSSFDRHLNEHFSRARPSNFLAQLPNIFGNNIASYFSIGGETITFTGDELAGMNAIDLAWKQISSGQSDIIIVGGVADGLKEHLMLYAALENRMCKHEFQEVWQRQGDGICYGSGAAFMVLESEQHARTRDIEQCFALDHVSVKVTPRDCESFANKTKEQITQGLEQISAGATKALLSCSAGQGNLCKVEAELCREIDPSIALRSSSNYTGALLEASLPFGIAAACLCLQKKRLLPAYFVDSLVESEVPNSDALDALLVNCWGHYSAEANVLVQSLGRGS